MKKIILALVCLLIILSIAGAAYYLGSQGLRRGKSSNSLYTDKIIVDESKDATSSLITVDAEDDASGSASSSGNASGSAIPLDDMIE